MTGEMRRRLIHFLFFYILLLHNSCSSSSSFSPADYYLISCGSLDSSVLDDGRTFSSDPPLASYLSTDKDITTSVRTLPPNPDSSPSLPLYHSARIFQHDSSYRFLVHIPGLHFIRLYFFALPHSSYNLTSATFTVSTDDFVLLHSFSVEKKMVFKEYLVNITSDILILRFSPTKNSFAFINAIELVSAPDNLISGEFTGAFEFMYRLNIGGPILTSKNDSLSRTWLPDSRFSVFPQGKRNVSVPPDMIRYPEGGASPLIAPYSVYSTADQMADCQTSNPNFNMTWAMHVDPSFNYLIRLHFCDIVSKGLNELYFNVYINRIIAVSDLDLSTLTSGLAIPYYKDFFLNSSSISNSSIVVKVGPSSNIISSMPNAILNGLEVMKLSNSDQSLDGLFFSSENRNLIRVRSYAMSKAGVGVGLALGVTALISLFVGILIRRRNLNKSGYDKQKTFSSWLIPLNPLNLSTSSFMSSKTKSSNFSTTFSFGRYFALSEIKNATKNFDEKSVVGVGGFGKVYLGEIDDGTKLAIKRGNPSSSQGINEFQTEIHLLSRLRHRHLVSLIGYCDEQSEMILVYEYMSRGPLRDHLYGSKTIRGHLTWRQRLEICIGSARGLHYLHTGSNQAIIHRDVKTTNILLDENFSAKVSDFGLSKVGPDSLEETHVSTAVKGSFGYLDPEYFRRQQLTEKSDVYSFGVVLFEVLCARPALDPRRPREEVNLAEWAKRRNGEGEIRKIVDPRIEGSIVEESLRKYVEAAEKCLSEYGVERPAMGDVLWNLECALQLQGDGEEGKRKDGSGVVVGSPMFLESFEGR